MKARLPIPGSGPKLLLGVVHLPPLPGSPRFEAGSQRSVLAAARRDAERIAEAGLDGYVLENFHDAPFWPERVEPWTLTWMTRIALELPREGLFVAANVLRNDARGALAVAAAADLAAIRVNVHTSARVTDQGIVEGRAAETMRERSRVAPEVAVLADVDVKHSSPLGAPRPAAEAAREAAERGLADAVIVTGAATGAAARLEDVEAVRAAVPNHCLLVGSGVEAATLGPLLEVADGVIVGTSIKRGGRVEEPVDLRRARRLVREARG